MKESNFHLLRSILFIIVQFFLQKKRSDWEIRHFFPLRLQGTTRYDRDMKKQQLWLKLLAVTLSFLLFLTTRHPILAETFAPSVNPTDSGLTSPWELTVITYNIRGCRDDQGIADPIAIADELKKLHGDIIALQEVDNGLPRSQFVNQAKMIADQLGLYYTYVPAVDFLVGTYGHALLSKYPITSAKAVTLPSGKEPRAMLDAVVLVDGQALHVYETHLGLSQSERKSQISVLQQYVKQSHEKDEAFLLLGDFNTASKNSLFKPILADVQAPFFHADQGLVSLRSSSRPEMIDQIFLSPNIRFDNGFTDDYSHSDHYPIGANITLPFSKT